MNTEHETSSHPRMHPARICAIVVCVIFVLVLFYVVWVNLRGLYAQSDPNQTNEPYQSEEMRIITDTTQSRYTTAVATTTTTVAATAAPAVLTVPTEAKALDSDAIFARNAALISLDDHRVLAARDAEAVIYPASLTKIMTMLTVLDSLDSVQMSGAYLMEGGFLDELRAQQAVCAGFTIGEPCRIIDLLYGMMLPSGADAAMGLAIYTAGTEEQFVTRMNDLAARMGLTHTHFENCTGLHDENHVSTVMEIACILETAMQKPLCRTILSSTSYTTAATMQHPAGLTVQSTLFSRVNGSELQGITIQGGKTGFTNEAGQCLATFAMTADGKAYLAIVTGCENKWDAVYDTLTIYQHYSSTANGFGPVIRYVGIHSEETASIGEGHGNNSMHYNRTIRRLLLRRGSCCQVGL